MAKVRTKLFTYVTKNDGRTYPIYQVDAGTWVEAKLRLESAGPVAVGTDNDLGPTVSGRGWLLAPGETLTITLDPASKLYIVAESVSRVGVVIQSFAWVEEITRLMGGVAVPVIRP